MATSRLELSFSTARCTTVVVGVDALAELPTLWRAHWRRAAIIGDRNTVGRFGAEVATALAPLADEVMVLDFAPGEAHKSRRTKAELEDRLLEAGFDRNCAIVGLGGGISLDVAGFVAATYLRGVASLYVPTSLLAQVDAAIGGKTAINTTHGKNLIGAFHQPRAVLIDPTLPSSLPAAEWPNGLAELVKQAVVSAGSLLDWIEHHAAELGAPQVLDAEPIERCVRAKGAIVCADEREQERRGVLNFGHTVGHGLESASGHRIAHGRAVAVGMLVEGRLAVDRGLLAAADLARLARLLGELGLGIVELPELPPWSALEPFVRRDKKRRGGELRLALPARIGAMAEGPEGALWPVEVAELRRAWQRVVDGEEAH